MAFKKARILSRKLPFSQTILAGHFHEVQDDEMQRGLGGGVCRRQKEPPERSWAGLNIEREPCGGKGMPGQRHEALQEGALHGTGGSLPRINLSASVGIVATPPQGAPAGNSFESPQPSDLQSPRWALVITVQ